MYIKPLKIGNVQLENNLFLAPMAGVTDLPFRMICKEFGPGLVATEMVSSKALFYNDEKTLKLLNTKGEKRPISMQLFGSDEESIEVATRKLNEIADIIDINMGCPAPKVVKNGDGSKLLLDLEKADKIMKTVIKNAKVPVTLKIRKGWDNEHIVAVEVAKMAEKNGISAITVHGRTRNEFYSGKADLDVIKKVKQEIKIPVIGNGDVVDEETAKRMFEQTGVDGIMIGRGSFGNPWIFRRILTYFITGKKENVVFPKEKLKIVKKHLELAIQEKDEITGIREMRKHIAWYTKGLPNASEFRQKINKIENREEVNKKLEEYFLFCENNNN